MGREQPRLRREPLKEPPSSPTLWAALGDITDLKNGQRALWRIFAVMFGFCFFSLLLHAQDCADDRQRVPDQQSSR